MSVWRRLERLVETFAIIELDEGSRFGADGEDDAERVLAGTGGHLMRNPVLPHPRKPGGLPRERLSAVHPGLPVRRRDQELARPRLVRANQRGAQPGSDAD